MKKWQVAVGICLAYLSLWSEFGHAWRLSSVRGRKGMWKMMAIAPFKRPRPMNAEGNLFVDESCIDCDVCRWMCPQVFGRRALKSYVRAQPNTTEELLQAYTAMVSCPVGSIRTREADPLVNEAIRLFPLPVDQKNLPGVYHLGFHSVKSFGATAYFIRSEEGNIMIDSPRFNTKLAKNIERMGGVTLMILTHKDDIADHAKWKERFPNMQRVIHRVDATYDSQDIEIKLSGAEQWHPTNATTIIHTPGHTAGSLCVLHRTAKDGVCFTGDHIAFDPDKNGLDGFKMFNHGNVDIQAQSMRLLAEEDFNFLWILPGHGRMAKFADLQQKKADLLAAADAFEEEEAVRDCFKLGIGR